jgi:hypothetical protein
MRQFNGRANGTTYFLQNGLLEATGATRPVLHQYGIIWFKGTFLTRYWERILGSLKLNQYRYRTFCRAAYDFLIFYRPSSDRYLKIDFKTNSMKKRTDSGSLYCKSLKQYHERVSESR